MSSSLHCPSCGRTPGEGPNGVSIATIDGEHWCGRCARVHQTEGGRLWIHRPSPGRMIEQVPVALDAWMDCYEMKPKIRITVREAEREIQRAWARWDGDKNDLMAKTAFYGWLWRHRPYFLTFRCRGDRWQRVKSWLIQYEQGNRQL